MTAEQFDALRFNALSDDEAAQRLRACCAARRWVTAMLAARPYESTAAALSLAAAKLAELDWAGVREALEPHPRIGERVAGAGREADWSRREQAGTADSSAETRADLVAANRAYEERFGHVFLIFATGRTDVEMLAAARARLRNDGATERETVRGELARIVALRLERTLRPERAPSA